MTVRSMAGVPDPEALPAAQKARRGRIVRAAIELLEVGEYDSVQMRDVAERAGVAVATVYRYFSSKEHLYAAALVEWSADFRPRNGPGGNGRVADGDEDRLRALTRRAVRAFERWPQLMRALIVIESSNDENARALWDLYAAQNHAALSSALANLEPDTAAAVVETVQSVMGGKLRSWALGRCSIDEVHAAIQRAISLIFDPVARVPSPPPVHAEGE